MGAPDQAVAVQHRMHGALGGNAHIAGHAADQQLADLACAPVGLLLLQPHDHLLDRLGQLVGIAHRPPRAVAERFHGINTSCQMTKSVTHVSGTNRHLSLKPLSSTFQIKASSFSRSLLLFQQRFELHGQDISTVLPDQRHETCQHSSCNIVWR